MIHCSEVGNNNNYITLPDCKVQMYDRDFDTYMKSFSVFREKCEEWIGDSDIMIAVENTDGFREYEKKDSDWPGREMQDAFLKQRPLRL